MSQSLQELVATHRRRDDLQGDVVDNSVRAAGRREIRAEAAAATGADLL